MSGHVYKRCGCPVHRDAKGKKLPCPRTHGSWTFVANATMEGPQPRRQHTKGGFATKREAEAALRAFQASVDRGEVQRQSKITVKDYVLRWLDAVEPSLAVTAAGNYRILMPGATSCASTTGPGRPGPPALPCAKEGPAADDIPSGAVRPSNSRSGALGTLMSRPSRRTGVGQEPSRTSS